MAAVAAAIAVFLAVALVVREQMWRRTAAALRADVEQRDQQLRQQEQRAHMTEMVSGLAHELKGPLQGVIGNTELMLASGGLHPASAADLREIQENAARAAGIVRNLVAVTDTHTLSRRWQDINHLATHAAVTVESDPAVPNLSVTLKLAERLPLIYVDGRQLGKVMATLLSGLARRDAPAPEVAAIVLATLLTAEGDRVLIDLEDRPGDADPLLGSGDLDACREIVAAHGGTLETGIVAGGRRVRLELPVTAADAAAAPHERS